MESSILKVIEKISTAKDDLLHTSYRVIPLSVSRMIFLNLCSDHAAGSGLIYSGQIFFIN